MGVKWRDFQMPKRLECDEASYTPTYGKFVAEPFERGYGVTLGNSLRRGRRGDHRCAHYGRDARVQHHPWRPRGRYPGYAEPETDPHEAL